MERKIKILISTKRFLIFNRKIRVSMKRMTTIIHLKKKRLLDKKLNYSSPEK